MLRFLRVADLRNLLGTFRLTKSGKREDLLRRLERLFSDPVLVQRCGGKTHVEEIISYHYNCVKGSNTSPKVTKLVGVLCDQEPVRAGQNRKTAGKVTGCNAMTSFAFSVRDLDGKLKGGLRLQDGDHDGHGRHHADGCALGANICTRAD